MKRTSLRTAIFTTLIACALLACGQEPPPPPVEAEPERAPAPMAPVAPAPAEVEPTAEEVPVPEDFEDEAEKDIKPTGLRAELDALEHEIASDAP